MTRLFHIGSKWQDFIVVILPLALYFLLTTPLFGWIIDDAGISFVYARNLASGHGLVSQPGAIPVEGFSNPLWIFLMAPFFLLNIFHPFIVPKVLSLILVSINFYFIHKTVASLTNTKFMISIIVLFFLSCNASYVIWTSSGLENPLLVALISVLLYLIFNTKQAPVFDIKQVVTIGILSATIALTRPDGILYAAVFPFAVVTANFPFNKGKYLAVTKTTAIYAVSFLVVFGAYFVFRIAYFGEIFPNTYYAKGGPTPMIVFDTLTLQQPYLLKLQEILKSVFHPRFWALIPAMLVLFLGRVLLKKELFCRELVSMLFYLFPYLPISFWLAIGWENTVWLRHFSLSYIRSWE